jgi:hypothetical protein
MDTTKKNRSGGNNGSALKKRFSLFRAVDTGFYRKIYNDSSKRLICGSSTSGVFVMAEESKEISSMTVIGIGIVLFIAVVGFWYLFLK